MKDLKIKNKYNAVPEGCAPAINAAIQNFTNQFRMFAYNMEDAWYLWEQLRASGRFCCLTIGSDYHHTFSVVLIEDKRSEDCADYEAASGHVPSFWLDVADVDAKLLLCLAFVWANRIEVASVELPWQSHKYSEDYADPIPQKLEEAQQERAKLYRSKH